MIELKEFLIEKLANATCIEEIDYWMRVSPSAPFVPQQETYFIQYMYDEFYTALTVVLTLDYEKREITADISSIDENQMRIPEHACSSSFTNGATLTLLIKQVEEILKNLPLTKKRQHEFFLED